MRNTIIFIVILILVIGGYYLYAGGPGSDPSPSSSDTDTPSSEEVSVTPIEHASGVLEWSDRTVYMDPVGDADMYADAPSPDVVVVTHTHPDHLSVDTLTAVMDEDATLVVPQTVADELPGSMEERTRILANGDEETIMGMTIRAIPMYNLPQNEDAYHVKGDGNGYVIERNNTRVYIAGDTSDIPEMRTLENIDIAFVPMNLPYTMDVSSAAEGVRAFAPDTVYPYHYRNQDGSYSDVAQFRTLVNEGDNDITVELAEWYPDR